MVNPIDFKTWDQWTVADRFWLFFTASMAASAIGAVLRWLLARRKGLLLRLSPYHMGKATQALQDFILKVRQGDRAFFIAKEYVVADIKSWDELTLAAVRIAADLAKEEHAHAATREKLASSEGEILRMARKLETLEARLEAVRK